ncbi:MAG: hypothetical protein ACFBRM_03650 [Pikeienuella sp.]
MTDTAQEPLPDAVMIAVPTADGIVTTGHVETVVEAAAAISASGRRYYYRHVDFVEVVQSRNHLVAMALARPETSHILFIDNDMLVPRQPIARLLAAGKPVAGVVYPKRRTNLEAYAQARMDGHDQATARALASPYVVQLPDGTLTVEKGLAQVDGVGFGCTLIELRLLRAMIADGRLGRQKPLDIGHVDTDQDGLIWNFFARNLLPNGQVLSEDYAFCARARAVEPGCVWAYLGPGALHQGWFNHGEGANFIDRLKALSALAQAAPKA